MKVFINKIFDQKGYSLSEGNGLSLFSYQANSLKKSYWALIERDNLDLLDEQYDLLAQCKTLNPQPELDKNCSLIILIKIKDQTELINQKTGILLIEENPFHFKKFVLCYSEEEHQQLITEQGDQTELEFLEQKILDQDVFGVYKSNPKALAWQSLVFRMALKFPFINIPITVSKGLVSLFELNTAKISAKSHTELDDQVIKYIGQLSIEKINQLKPEDVLKKLSLKSK